MVLRRWLPLVFLVLSLAALWRLGNDTHDESWRRCENEDPALALDACTAIIKLNQEGPENRAVAFSNRAIAYGDRRDYPHAIADATESLKLLPRADTYYLRGRLHAAARNYAAAIDDYDATLRLNPGHENAKRFRAAAQDALGAAAR
jgi:tetratricopeptide (TPR) repeat protein